jgi:hypothetical protein
VAFDKIHNAGCPASPDRSGGATSWATLPEISFDQALHGVEAKDTDRVVVLPVKQVVDDGFEVGFFDLGPRQTRPN